MAGPRCKLPAITSRMKEWLCSSRLLLPMMTVIRCHGRNIRIGECTQYFPQILFQSPPDLTSRDFLSCLWCLCSQ